MDDQTALQVRRSFHSAPERVFDAWINPSIARQFLFATPTGEIVRCDIDARPGGRLTITRRDESGETEHVGEYFAVDPPRRLMFTFGVPRFSPEMTRVQIDIAATAEGCELALTHEGVPPDWREKTIEGWTMILETLSRVLE